MFKTYFQKNFLGYFYPPTLPNRNRVNICMISNCQDLLLVVFFYYSLMTVKIKETKLLQTFSHWTLEVSPTLYSSYLMRAQITGLQHTIKLLLLLSFSLDEKKKSCYYFLYYFSFGIETSKHHVTEDFFSYITFKKKMLI